MNDHPQPGQAFMSALVTEHFVLQSARSTTVSEAVGRSAIYLTCVSSAVVAFGFFAAATHRLAPVVATVLPALIILGIFTFVRLVETSVENVVFLRRIEAIRRYYAALDPAAAAFFASPDSNAATAALASTGMHAGIGGLVEAPSGVPAQHGDGCGQGGEPARRAQADAGQQERGAGGGVGDTGGGGGEGSGPGRDGHRVGGGGADGDEVAAGGGDDVGGPAHLCRKAYPPPPMADRPGPGSRPTPEQLATWLKDPQTRVQDNAQRRAARSASPVRRRSKP